MECIILDDIVTATGYSYRAFDNSLYWFDIEPDEHGITYIPMEILDQFVAMAE